MERTLLLLGMIFCVIPNPTHSAVKYHVYNLTFAFESNASSVVLVNKQLPGPIIRANLHDIIVVHARNALDTDEELSVHFHGIHQRKTPQMDGVAFFTQMPIPRGQTFTYSFYAYPAGTYFYHSHSGLQFTTAFGPLIIDDPDREWSAKEIPPGPIMFSDHWEGKDRITQETGILSSPFQWIGEPTNLLINGRRDFVMTLRPRRKYLLRLIGATSLSTVVFGIDDHQMKVVEVDGQLVKPKGGVTSIEIASGQRYAVIVETGRQTRRLFTMQVAIRWRAPPANSSVLGILRYNTDVPIPKDWSSLPLPPLYNETQLLRIAYKDEYRTLLHKDKIPRGRPDREILLVSTQDRTPDGLGIRWMTNNATFVMSSIMHINRSLLLDLSRGVERNLPHDVVYTVKQNEIVDVVVQNTVALNGVCESHPMHLHGHSFWIHSRGTGVYDPTKNARPDLRKPVLRDSMMMYATEYGYFTANRNGTNHRKPCGWTKVRFIADNPGLWMLHCHIGAHSVMGMTVFLKEDIKHLTMLDLV